MEFLEQLLTEARSDLTFELGAALLITLAITRSLVPREERRTAGTVILYALHLLLLPVAAWLRWTSAGPGSLEHSLHAGVRMGVLVLGAVVAIGVVAQLLFEVLLPRIKVQSPRILRDLTVAIGAIIATLAIATRLGFNLSGIIATSAVLTAIIAFSLQDTLGNIMGGLALQLEGSISVGDWIKVGEVAGRVREIRWRFIAIETRNWETVIFPNSMLSKAQVTIIGRRAGQPVQWRRWIWFNVGVEHAPSEVIRVAHAAVADTPMAGVSINPGPSCVLMDFGEAGHKFALRYWLTDLAADDGTDSAVRARLHFALQRADIDLTWPTRTLHVSDDGRRQDSESAHDLARRLKVLERLELFRELETGERDHIAAALMFAPFGRGEVLTHQGNVAHYLYIVVKGEVSVRVAVDGGLDQQVSQLSGPCFVGEMGLLTGEPRTATIVAATDVQCYRLEKGAFQSVLQQRPELAGKLAEILTRRKVELEAVREGLSVAAKERRVKESSAQVLGKIRDFFGL